MRIVKKGATSQSIYFSVLDSASTTGGKKTAIVYNAAGLTAYYTRNGAAAVAITLATLASASAAFSSGGFILVSDANAPGLYRLDVPDAALATGVDSVVITLKGATGMVQVDIEIQLVALDFQDTVRAGLTSLPNAAAEAAGGLYTRGTGAGQINQPANGRVDVNTIAVSGTTQTAGDIPARLPAALTANGNMKSSLLEIITTALTEGAAGRIAAAWQGMFNVTSPVLTAQSVNQTGDGFARLGAPAGASHAADVAAVKTDTGNLVTRITSTLFSGITQLSHWLGMIAGKQAANSTAQTEIRATGAGSGTYDATTDSLEALKDGSANMRDFGIMQVTTIATLASQTSFTLTAGSADNNAYVGAKVMITDATTEEQKAVGVISAYTGSTKTVTLQEDPAIFTMAVGDNVCIQAPAVDVFKRRVDGTTTFEQSTRLQNSAAGAKLSGAATTTVAIRDLADSKNRVSATVDSDGNRSAVTLDLT